MRPAGRQQKRMPKQRSSTWAQTAPATFTQSDAVCAPQLASLYVGGCRHAAYPQLSVLFVGAVLEAVLLPSSTNHIKLVLVCRQPPSQLLEQLACMRKYHKARRQEHMGGAVQQSCNTEQRLRLCRGSKCIKQRHHTHVESSGARGSRADWRWPPACGATNPCRPAANRRKWSYHRQPGPAALHHLRLQRRPRRLPRCQLLRLPCPPRLQARPPACWSQQSRRRQLALTGAWNPACCRPGCRLQPWWQQQRVLQAAALAPRWQPVRGASGGAQAGPPQQATRRALLLPSACLLGRCRWLSGRGAHPSARATHTADSGAGRRQQQECGGSRPMDVLQLKYAPRLYRCVQGSSPWPSPPGLVFVGAQEAPELPLGYSRH